MKYETFIIILLLLLISPPITKDGGVEGDNAGKTCDKDSRGQLFFDDSPYEYRSMWLEGYQIVNISEVKAVVEYARKYNFNVLSPLINGDYRGVFYNSTYFDRHPDLAWHFDPLMELIREAHKYGIQVHPWWHTLYSYPILRENPQWRCMSSSGSYSWVWVNPAIEGARSYVRNTTMEVVKKYPIDGIKLDTIRYGGSSYSFDAYTIEKFNRSGMDDFNVFRRSQVTETVKMIHSSIMEEKPWLWVGADVFSSHWGRLNGVFQEPEVWAEQGIIDYMTPMLYTNHTPSYGGSLEEDVDNIGCHVVAGTYIYIPGNTAHGSVPNETAGIDLMIEQVETAQSLGAWGICAFAYKFLREYPSYGRALEEGPFNIDARSPVKEQDIPSDKGRWEFEREHDREGWNLFDSGHFYPGNGVWSISGEDDPKLLSPRLNITSSGINVIEVSALIEEGVNCTLQIYWGQMIATMDDTRMVESQIKGDGDWDLYSIHLDNNIKWAGVVTYLLIVPIFEKEENITIDLISLHWMPYCIRECSYLGPYTTGGDLSLLDKEFIDNEGHIYPRSGDVYSGRMWQTLSVDRDLVDFRFPLGRKTYSVVYSHIYIRSDRDIQADLRIGSSDGIKVWFNGEIAVESPGERSVSPDQNITRVSIKEGFNSLFVKLAVHTGEFSYFIRLTDEWNGTIDDLSHMNDIPRMEAPGIQMENGSWVNEGDINISLNPPDSVAGIDHYRISIDGERNFTSGGPYIRTGFLENGIHDIEVKAIDGLGFSGETGRLSFGVDNTEPITGRPFSDETFATEPRIRWKWDGVSDMPSGLRHYEVWIEHGTMDDPASETMGPFPVKEQEFELDSRMINGHQYTCRIRAVTNSGMTYSSRSSEPVILDLSAPEPPSGIDLFPLDISNRTYRLVWGRSTDNIPDGIEGYEIIFEGRNRSRTVYSTGRSYIFQRDIGCSPAISIIPVDKAGNRGSVSPTVEVPNQEPVIDIDQEPIFKEGGILNIDSGDCYDPDGVIVDRLWILDGVNVSREEDLRITLEEGYHLVELIVTDDLGSVSRRMFSYDIGSGSKNYNGSFREWLVSESLKEKVLPQENITIYRYHEPEPREEDPLITGRADLIDISLLILVCIFLLSFLLDLVSVTQRYATERETEFIIDEYTNDDELGRPDEWDDLLGFEETENRLIPVGGEKESLPSHSDTPRAPSLSGEMDEGYDPLTYHDQGRIDISGDEEILFIDEEDKEESLEEWYDADEVILEDEWDELDELEEELDTEPDLYETEEEP